MTPSVEQLRRVRPAALRATARELEGQRLILVDVIARLLAARPAGMSWAGPAADAAAGESARRLETVRAICLDLTASVSALHYAATAFDEVLELLRRADLVAEQAGAWISAGGRLVLPQRLPTGDPALDAARIREDERARWEITALLERAGALGSTTDAALAADLMRALEKGACLLGPTGAALPPPPATRATVLVPEAGRDGAADTGPLSDGEGAPFIAAAWWRSLTQEQQATVVREHPAWIGGLDGIPARDRDAANRTLLVDAEQRAAEEQRKAEALKAPLASAAFLGGALLTSVAASIARRRAQERVDDLRAVRKLIDARDDRRRQLLLLDASAGRVRAAISLGDVDVAEHVSTYVGGFTTRAADLPAYDTSFAALGDRVEQLTGVRPEDPPSGARRRPRVAYVTWVGYDAPQRSDVLLPDRSVLRDRVAREAAPALARFLNGIDASRDVPPHSVVLGHSYGSLVTANALRFNTGVDDVALFGSPGVGGAFTSLFETGLKPGGLNVLKADRDLVAASGWFPVDPAQIAGATLLSTSTVLLPGSPKEIGSASTGHSDYLKPGSTSQHNLAALILHRPDLFVHVAPS